MTLVYHTSGAGSRTDFHVVAWPKNRSRSFSLGYAYHTTNVVEGTTSNRPGFRYLESRILWVPQCDLGSTFNQAMMDLMQTYHLPIFKEGLGLIDPHVGELNVSDDEEDMDEAS